MTSSSSSFSRRLLDYSGRTGLDETPVDMGNLLIK
jgi:hypothetical protein